MQVIILGDWPLFSWRTLHSVILWLPVKSGDNANSVWLYVSYLGLPSNNDRNLYAIRQYHNHLICMYIFEISLKLHKPVLYPKSRSSLEATLNVCIYIYMYINMDDVSESEAKRILITCFGNEFLYQLLTPPPQ